MEEMTNASMVFVIGMGLAVFMVIAVGAMLLTNWMEEIADQRQVMEAKELLSEIQYSNAANTDETRGLLIYPYRGIAYVRVTNAEDRIREETGCGEFCLCAFKLNEEFPEAGVIKKAINWASTGVDWSLSIFGVTPETCRKSIYGVAEFKLGTDGSVRALLNSPRSTILGCEDVRKYAGEDLEEVGLYGVASGYVTSAAWGLPPYVVKAKLNDYLGRELSTKDIVMMTSSACVNTIGYRVEREGNRVKLTLTYLEMTEK